MRPRAKSASWTIFFLVDETHSQKVKNIELNEFSQHIPHELNFVRDIFYSIHLENEIFFSTLHKRPPLRLSLIHWFRNIFSFRHSPFFYSLSILMVDNPFEYYVKIFLSSIYWSHGVDSLSYFSWKIHMDPCDIVFKSLLCPLRFIYPNGIT